MNELQLLGRAIEIAAEAHKGQKDRYGAPYILHPIRVLARVDSDIERIVAILHDVVEDTDWKFSDLEKEGFPTEVISALRAVTKQEGEEYKDFVKRSAADPIARQVKIADLEDNMDVRRMPVVDEKAQERLQKYLDAWTELKKPK